MPAAKLEAPARRRPALFLLVRALLSYCSALSLVRRPSPQLRKQRAYLVSDERLPWRCGAYCSRKIFSSLATLGPPPGANSNSLACQRELLSLLGFGFLFLYAPTKPRTLQKWSEERVLAARSACCRLPLRGGTSGRTPGAASRKKGRFSISHVIFLDFIEEGGAACAAVYHNFLPSCLGRSTGTAA